MGPDLAVAFGAPSPPRSRRRVHAARSDALLSPLGPPCRHRELVNQIVHRIPRVALHPTEHDATAPHDLDERLPQVTPRRHGSGMAAPPEGGPTLGTAWHVPVGRRRGAR